MKPKFLRGMNLQEQKKCGILMIAIGLVMFVIGFLLGDALYAGMERADADVRAGPTVG